MRFEMFATGTVTTDALWSVVGDLWRLPEWTDVEAVADVTPEPVNVGTAVQTAEGGTTRLWRVVTWEPRLYELSADTERGTMGFGCRVVRDARGGSRLVLAGGVEVRGAAAGLRARLVDGPALRRRMEQWAAAAFRVVALPTGEGPVT